MPERDQVIQTVRDHLNCAMRWVKAQTHNREGIDACNKCWTLAMKAALCHASMKIWGERNSLRICASRPALVKPGQTTVCYQTRGHICAAAPGPYPWRANKPEWLYDVTCLRYKDRWPAQQQALLVAETEWGDPNTNLLPDFAKLLVARAELRVMIYHGPPRFDELANFIRRCFDTTAGDTYLLATFNHRMKYCRIDDQGAHPLPKITSDCYPQ